MAYKGRTEFRSSRFAIGMFVGLSAFLLVLSTVALQNAEPAWVTWSCWAFFAFSLLAITDVLTQFVTLGDTELRLRRNLRLRVIPRENIESIAIAKGCPALLILKDGEKVELPPLDSISMGNSIRAWLKATDTLGKLSE